MTNVWAMANVDFPNEFVTCQTITEANTLYKRLYGEHRIDRCSPQYWGLSEAHRRTLERLSGLAVEPKVRQEPKPGTVRSIDVRNWARRQGIAMPPKGKPSKQVVDAYNEAHGIPVEAPKPKRAGNATVDAALVRAWAKEQGIEVASRGRLHGDVIGRYLAAHTEGA